MSDRFLADSFYYAHRLQQLEDENLDLRKKIEDLESTNQDLESSNDSHLRQVHDLELEIERLTSLNHELSSTLEHDASATASRPPSFFSQLCWAHFLRKSAELMLRNPTNSSYRQFYIRLLLLYRLAKRYQKDQRLSVGRAAKVQELQQKVLKLCKRYGEEIMTESKSEKNGDDPSRITSESDAKMIRLQNELVEKLDCLFVFVEHPEVESTNNRSERNLRGEAIARKTAKASKSKNGAERRGIIISVLGTMKQRLNEFSLKNIVKFVKKSYKKGVSLFAILKPPNLKSPQSQ